jgi:hypothetical protein
VTVPAPEIHALREYVAELERMVAFYRRYVKGWTVVFAANFFFTAFGFVDREWWIVLINIAGVGLSVWMLTYNGYRLGEFRTLHSILADTLRKALDESTF